MLEGVRSERAKAVIAQVRVFFAFAPVGRAIRDVVHPGCRLTLFALPWAGGFWAFSPNGRCEKKVSKVVKVFRVARYEDWSF